MSFWSTWKIFTNYNNKSTVYKVFTKRCGLSVWGVGSTCAGYDVVFYMYSIQLCKERGSGYAFESMMIREEVCTHETNAQSQALVTPQLLYRFTGARFNFKGLQRRRTVLLPHHEGHTWRNVDIFLNRTIYFLRQYYLRRLAALANP